MPRYYREVDNADVLHFGVGDIGMGSGSSAETGKPDQVVFWVGEPGDIGRHEPAVKGLSTVDLPGRKTVFAFENIESLEVLLECLLEFRARMAGIANNAPLWAPRKAYEQAFKSDPSFRQAYVDNVAMLLHDRHGITDYEARNRAADEIIRLVFEQ